MATGRSGSASTMRFWLLHGISGFVLRRALLGLLTLVLVSVVVFAATQALPGDAARAGRAARVRGRHRARGAVGDHGVPDPAGRVAHPARGQPVPAPG